MPAPDRALRRLVAQLAGARQDDIEAVLEALAPQHRARIEALIADYRGEALAPFPSPSVDEEDADAFLIDGLSPWLLARLQRSSQSGESGPITPFREMTGAEARQAGLEYKITPVAFEVLRACAASLTDADAGSARSRGSPLQRLFGGRS